MQLTRSRRLQLMLAGLISVLLPGCDTSLTERIVLNWRVEGSTAAALCDVYEIASWTATAIGDQILTIDRECRTDIWTSGDAFDELLEGTYTVGVEANDLTGTSVGCKIDSVDLATGFPEVVDLNLTPEDFNGCEIEGLLTVRWNINGTDTGEADGASWDTCEEVGAEQVVIRTDGIERTLPCDTPTMSSTSFDTALTSHSVEVWLRDRNGERMTTTAASQVDTSDGSGEFIAEFYYDSFVAPHADKSGNFRFTKAFRSASSEQRLGCNDVSPPMQSQAVLLLDSQGNPVDGASTVYVCGEGVDPDGPSASTLCRSISGLPDLCRGPDEVQSISALPWGHYKLRIQASPFSSSEVCWQTNEKEELPLAWESRIGNDKTATFVDIIIGAGENPVVDLEMRPLSSASSACLP